MSASDAVPLTPSARQGNTGFAMSMALLVVRLALAWVFIFHGGQKLFGWWGGSGLEGFASHMPELPVLSKNIWAMMAAGGEFFGGVSMLLGLLGRLGAVSIIVTMLVAIATVTGQHGFDALNHGCEYNVALIAMAGAVLVAGPGLLSADAFLFRRGLWARGPQPLENPSKRGG
jgi:putative oxidoreductase